MSFVITPPAAVAVPVVGTSDQFPVRRVYCVGRNYEEHAGTMLVELASAEFCDQGQMPMLLQLVLRDCPGLIASQEQTLSALAGRFSTRWNFGLGSVYHLSMGGQQLLPGLQLPTVDVLTLGFAGQFVPLRVSTSDGAWQ